MRDTFISWTVISERPDKWKLFLYSRRPVRDAQDLRREMLKLNVGNYVDRDEIINK